MEKQQINKFIEQIKLETTYKKFLESNIINLLLSIFNTTPYNGIEKLNYSNNIINPLKFVLEFFKDFNIKYYNTIMTGFKNGKIIISKDNTKSFTDTNNNKTIIKIYENDGDLFIIAHELAHFIDRNSYPQIIPNKYWFLSETFAFYIEKRLQSWLGNKYKDLIFTRNNNRLHYEKQMLKAIENELFYENLYLQNGIIDERDIDIQKIKSIIQYDIPFNIVNYLLQYPLANIISSYLINTNMIQDNNNFAEICISINLYELLEEVSLGKHILILTK